MYKVKLTFPYPEWDIKRQTPGSQGVWGNCKFFINEKIEECDYWFVFDHLLEESEEVQCPENRTFLITAEPPSVHRYGQEFIDQFRYVVTCQNHLKHVGIIPRQQGLPWFVGAQYQDGRYTSFSKGYDELNLIQSIEKRRMISIITSDKQITDGHKIRFDFAMKLKESFGNAIDLFGRGVHTFEDKWDALADYKYSIAIENSYYDDYFTEKLSDCFLAHTFPLYYGCPNVASYFDERSLIRVDIGDLENSKRTLDYVLGAVSHYQTSIPFIRKSREKCLNEYNLFPLIEDLIKRSSNSSLSKKRLKRIYSKPAQHMSLPSRIIRKLSRGF